MCPWDLKAGDQRLIMYHVSLCTDRPYPVARNVEEMFAWFIYMSLCTLRNTERLIANLAREQGVYNPANIIAAFKRWNKW